MRRNLPALVAAPVLLISAPLLGISAPFLGGLVPAVATPAGALAGYPACLDVRIVGIESYDTGHECTGSFTATYCDTPTVTTPVEVVRVETCVPDGVMAASVSPAPSLSRAGG